MDELVHNIFNNNLIKFDQTDVKRGSVFSFQVWGGVSSPQTQGNGVKLPLFLIMYVFKYFSLQFWGGMSSLQTSMLQGLKKYLLQCFSKNQTKLYIE